MNEEFIRKNSYLRAGGKKTGGVAKKTIETALEAEAKRKQNGRTLPKH